jgi:hypothetical protein
MAASNYDVNLQLALATTAEHEGDLDSALEFLAEAHHAARDDREARAQVHWFTAHFRARRREHAALELFAAAF